MNEIFSKCCEYFRELLSKMDSTPYTGGESNEFFELYNELYSFLNIFQRAFKIPYTQERVDHVKELYSEQMGNLCLGDQYYVNEIVININNTFEYSLNKKSSVKISQLDQIIADCVKNNNKIYLLNLIQSSPVLGAHRNLLLIDIPTKNVFRIEPNEIKESDKLNGVLSDFFEGSGYSFKGFYDTCPIDHPGLCAMVVFAQYIYGNRVTHSDVKDVTINLMNKGVDELCEKIPQVSQNDKQSAVVSIYFGILRDSLTGKLVDFILDLINGEISISLKFELAEILIGNGNLFSVITVVRENKELVNIPDGKGITLLLYAIRHKQLSIARYLLKNGADVNTKDPDEDTALHYAVDSEDVSLVKLLLKYGANPELLNSEGFSPLTSAEANVDDDDSGNLKKIIKLFLEIPKNNSFGTFKNNGSTRSTRGTSIPLDIIEINKLIKYLQGI